MDKTQKYWLIQCIGWGLFAILNIYIYFLSEGFHFNVVLSNILLSAGGLTITHFYRAYLINNKWYELNTTELIFRVLVSNILLAFAICIWQYLLVNVIHNHLETVSSFRLLFEPFIAAYIILLSWNLIYFTWSYIEKNRTQMIDRLQMQNDMQELELKSMRSNLQPHFIFNSLNSIRALVNEDPNAAREAVTKLSKILRTSISTKDNSITLDEELTLVENYLHLEKIRFEERLQYEFQIAAKTRPSLIPPMLIQNMVENAVKHGISLREQGGTIIISTEIELERIIISIKNEGTINEENKLKGTGFGMSSSQKRLNYLYPEASQINMLERDGFVVVEISIPNNIKPYEN